MLTSFSSLSRTGVDPEAAATLEVIRGLAGDARGPLTLTPLEPHHLLLPLSLAPLAPLPCFDLFLPLPLPVLPPRPPLDPEELVGQSGARWLPPQIEQMCGRLFGQGRWHAPSFHAQQAPPVGSDVLAFALGRGLKLLARLWFESLPAEVFTDAFATTPGSLPSISAMAFVGSPLARGAVTLSHH